MTEIYEDFYKQTPYLILFLWLTFHTMSLEMYFFIFQSLKTTGIFSLFFFLNAALFCFPLHCFILERETLYHVCYLWFPYFTSLINNHHLDHKLILNKIIPVLFEFCLCFISLTIKHFVLAWALKWIIITTPQQKGAPQVFLFSSYSHPHPLCLHELPIISTFYFCYPCLTLMTAWFQSQEILTQPPLKLI